MAVTLVFRGLPRFEDANASWMEGEILDFIFTELLLDSTYS